MANRMLEAQRWADVLFDPLESRVDEVVRACERGDIAHVFRKGHPDGLRAAGRAGFNAFMAARAEPMSPQVAAILEQLDDELTSALAPMRFVFDDLPRDGDALRERFEPLYRLLQDAEKPLGMLQKASKQLLGVSAATLIPIDLGGFADTLADIVVDTIAVKGGAAVLRVGSDAAQSYLNNRSGVVELTQRIEAVLNALGSVRALIEPTRARLVTQLTAELEENMRARRRRAMIGLAAVAAVGACAALATLAWFVHDSMGSREVVQLGSSAGRDGVRDVEDVLGDAPGAKQWRALLDEEGARFGSFTTTTARREELERAFVASAQELRQEWGLIGLCGRLERLEELGLTPTLGGFRAGCGDLAEAEAAVEEEQRAHRSAEAAYERAASEVASARSALEAAQRTLAAEQARYPLFVGWLYGELDARVYEVGDAGGRYVLRTVGTTYTTRGRVELRVELCGNERVTLRNGLVDTYPCLRQADTSSIVLAQDRVGAAYRRLDAARRAAPRRPDASGTTEAQARLERRRAMLDATLRRAVEAPAPSAPTPTTPGSSTAGILEGICPTAAGAPERCISCPEGTIYEDATPQTRVSGRVDLGGGKVLVEVEDQACFHHTHAFRTVYLMDRSGPPKVLAELHGARASECVSAGSEVVCAIFEAHHGSVHSRIVAVDTTDGKTRELVTTEDSLDASCMARGSIVQGYTLEGVRAEKNGIRVSLTRRRGTVPFGVEDWCEAEEAGTLALEEDTVTVRLVSRAGRLAPERDGPLPLEFGADALEPIEPARLTDAALARTLADLPGSPEGWVLHRRRLGALRYRGDMKGLMEMTRRLVASHPERAGGLLSELAADCEGARDYACAAWAHTQRLARSDAGDAEELAAAWFFTTADGARDLERARSLTAGIEAKPSLEPRRSLLLAELALHAGDVESARIILDGVEGAQAEDKRSRLDDPDDRLEQAPGDQIPPRPFKGAREWGDDPPTGAFGAEELAVGLHWRAQALARKKKYADAAALYEAARARATSDEVRVVVELGWGKLHERAGKKREAFEHYRSLAVRYPEHDRVLNRLAWFALTTPEVHDLELGHDLARRASALTDDRDPSVLDTLVEAHAQRGEWREALILNVRCRALDPARDYYDRRFEQLENKRTTAMRRLAR
jgi:tetratricopeptide (TPR) repeat protein